MKEIIKITLLICTGLLSLSAYSQDNSKENYVTLKLKVYLESQHAYADMADNLVVRVDEMIDRTVFEYDKKTGRFSLKLNMDKHYVIYFTQEGYETRSMVFSTVGADQHSKYVFRADIMLKRSDATTSESQSEMASVKFDYMNKNEFVINDNHSRIKYSVKNK